MVNGLGNTEEREARVTVEKSPNRAGATPLFSGQAAQKFCGVAPALRHKNFAVPFFHGDRRIVVCTMKVLTPGSTRINS